MSLGGGKSFVWNIRSIVEGVPDIGQKRVVRFFGVAKIHSGASARIEARAKPLLLLP